MVPLCPHLFALRLTQRKFVSVVKSVYRATSTLEHLPLSRASYEYPDRTINYRRCEHRNNGFNNRNSSSSHARSHFIAMLLLSQTMTRRSVTAFSCMDG